MRKRKKRLSFLFICSFIFSFILLTSIDAWINRELGNGWIWRMISRLVGAYGNGLDVGFFSLGHGIIFENPLVISVSEITGLKIGEVYYIPFLLTIPIIILYPFAKTLVNSKNMALMISFAIFIMLFSKEKMFRGYALGLMLFPLFIFVLIKYIKQNDKRLLVSSIFLLIGIKFFAPHYEIWAISFLLLITIFLMFNSKFKLSKSINHDGFGSLKIYSILSVIILLSYQPKGEDFLYHVYAGIYDLDIVTYALNFLGIRGVQEGPTAEYAVTPRSALIPSLLNQAIYMILGVAVLVSVLWWIKNILKNRKSFLKKLNLKDIISWSLFLAPIPHGIMKLAINQPGYLQIVLRLIGPFFIYYTFKKRSIMNSADNKMKTTIFSLKNRKNLKIHTLVITILIILVLSHHLSYIAYQTQNSVGSDEMNESAAVWMMENQNSPVLLTDWDTHNLLLYYMAKNEYNISEVGDLRFSDDRYSFVIGKGNESVGNQMDYFIIDTLNIETPLLRGGGYVQYEPLDKYHDDIRRNPKINLIYSSNDFEIYTSNV